MTRTTLAAGTSLAVLLLASSASAATVTIAGASVGKERDLLRQTASEWEEQTGHTVEIASVPDSTSEQLALYQQILSAQSGDIDVFPLDVVFVPTLAQHMVDLSSELDDSFINQFRDTLLNANTVDGRLVGLPKFPDVPMLYYRKDLLEKYDVEVPETWEELRQAARTIQEGERETNNKFRGYLFQGRAYEGLTCVGVEMVKSHGGGSVVADDGSITINNENAHEAINKLGSFIGDITPQAALNYNEPDTDGVFRNGNAAFMRNWPYVWGIIHGEGSESDLQGDVGVAQLPRAEGSDQRGHCLGGWQLGVNRYSDNASVAADFVRYVTSQPVQKRRWNEGSYLPTSPALYQDGTMEGGRSEEIVPVLNRALDNLAVRPAGVTGDKYNRVSNEFYNSIHDVLSGDADAEDSLADLERTLQRISRGGRW